MYDIHDVQFAPIIAVPTPSFCDYSSQGYKHRKHHSKQKKIPTKAALLSLKFHNNVVLGPPMTMTLFVSA